MGPRVVDGDRRALDLGEFDRPRPVRPRSVEGRIGQESHAADLDRGGRAADVGNGDGGWAQGRCRHALHGSRRRPRPASGILDIIHVETDIDARGHPGPRGRLDQPRAADQGHPAPHQPAARARPLRRVHGRRVQQAAPRPRRRHHPPRRPRHRHRLPGRAAAHRRVRSVPPADRRHAAHRSGARPGRGRVRRLPGRAARGPGRAARRAPCDHALGLGAAREGAPAGGEVGRQPDGVRRRQRRHRRRVPRRRGSHPGRRSSAPARAGCRTKSGACCSPTRLASTSRSTRRG